MFYSLKCPENVSEMSLKCPILCPRMSRFCLEMSHCFFRADSSYYVTSSRLDYYVIRGSIIMSSLRDLIFNHFDCRAGTESLFPSCQ